MLASAEKHRNIDPELLAWATEENESQEWSNAYHRDYIANEGQLAAEQEYGVFGHYWDAAGAYVYGYRGQWPVRD